MHTYLLKWVPEQWLIVAGIECPSWGVMSRDLGAVSSDQAWGLEPAGLNDGDLSMMGSKFLQRYFFSSSLEINFTRLYNFLI